MSPIICLRCNKHKILIKQINKFRKINEHFLGPVIFSKLLSYVLLLQLLLLKWFMDIDLTNENEVNAKYMIFLFRML